MQARPFHKRRRLNSLLSSLSSENLGCPPQNPMCSLHMRHEAAQEPLAKLLGLMATYLEGQGTSSVGSGKELLNHRTPKFGGPGNDRDPHGNRKNLPNLQTPMEIRSELGRLPGAQCQKARINRDDSKKAASLEAPM